MRLPGLLAIVLILVIVFFAVPAASYGQMASFPDTVKSDRASAPAPDASQPLAQVGRSRRWASPVQWERDGVCYTMRTYVMAREDPHSDATRLARYAKCLPAWKLEFKSAVAPLAQPDK